jgi:hypothetical protein
MSHLFFVGDGPRDEATLPPLVKGILKQEFTHKFRAWSGLRLGHAVGGHRLRGYGRKLLFALRQARDDRADGLVATVDRDEGKEGRLAHLRKARKADQEKWPGYPAAIGEAIPHAEAWLLDDQRAVRETLGLPRDCQIPTVTDVENPKRTLHELWESSPRRDANPAEREIEHVLPQLAVRVDETRCAHARHTGFKAFVKEIRREIGPIFEAG